MWKLVQMILILKSGKTANEVKSYRPISLLPVTSKLFEKLLLKRNRNDLGLPTAILDHQFRFRGGHSTIQQTNKIITNHEERNTVYSSFP
jgi:hypothetical protein